MAEKPRLKETDEIFSSLGKNSAGPSLAPSETVQGASETAQNGAPMITSALDDAASPEAPATAPAPSPSRRRRQVARAQEEPTEDSRPLDFGKYTLPKRGEPAPELPSPEPEAKPSRRKKQPEPEEPAQEDAVQLPSAKDLAAALLKKPGSRGAAEAPPKAATSKAPSAAPARSTASARSASPPSSVPTAVSKNHEAPSRSVASQRSSTPQSAQPEVREYMMEDFDNPFTPIDEPDAPQPARRRSGTRRDAHTAARVQADADLVKSSAGNKQTSQRSATNAPTSDLFDPFGGNARQNDSATANQPSQRGAANSPTPDLFDPFGGNARQNDSAPARRQDAVADRQNNSGSTPEERQAPPREQHRENFLKRLSSQFEKEFIKKFEEDFEGKNPAPEPLPDWVEPQPRPAAPDAGSLWLLPDEEEATDTEAERFFQDFEQQVQQEKEVRSETFKDTLAEKFERERQRYLRELGIDHDAPTPPPSWEFEPPEPVSDEPPKEPKEPPRRRLDMQIQPDMHIGDAPRPVTYNRAGAVTPQTADDSEDNLPYMPEEPDVTPSFMPPTADSEQIGLTEGARLLMQLGAQNAMRAHQTPAPDVKKQPKTLSNFKFSDEEDLKKTEAEKTQKPAKRGFRRVVAVSAVAALCVLAIALGPYTVNWIRSLDNSAATPPGPAQNAVLPQDAMTIYESRRPAVRENYADILIRRGGISVQNMSVDNHVVIGDIATRGEILLGEMTVGGSIYVQSCGINFLQLRDVTASRVIINNELESVTVEVLGASNIGTIEMKTSGEIRQSGLDANALGIETVVVQGSDPDNGISVKLDGIRLNSLDTVGDNTIALAGGASITGLTSKGNLSLTGSGSVVNMSASAKTGDNLAELRIRDVSVANMIVKSPSSLTLNSQVDSVSSSDELSIQGGGTVGILTVLPQFDNRRLPVDLFDTNVGNIIANSQLVVRTRGSSQIAALTANESVYQLGNKVNRLIVNDSNVVYENTPDMITTGNGIRPPSSVADNPNLDYTLTTAAHNTISTDLTSDDVSTTCNHPRENGGFVRGDGSVNNPFEVETAAQLAHVGSHLNSHFIQTANIDISQDSSFASGFHMIASGGTPFSGVYNGGGWAITGLRIHSDSQNVGLFAENKGTIGNLHILSGNIESVSDQRAYVGAVAGLNFDGGRIEGCSNGALVSGGVNAYVGGITGYNYNGRVRDSYNYAKLSGSANVGGIAGVNRGDASIGNSYNAGSVDAQTDSGGITGVNNGGTITNSYFLAGSAANGVGSGGGNVVEKTVSEMASAQMARDLAAGNENSNWITPSPGSTYTFPILGAPPQVTSPTGSDRVYSNDDSSDSDGRPTEVETLP